MKTNAQIVITMPLQGKITVVALGKGKLKVKAVEMLEELRPRLLRTFQCWYQMQLEIVKQTGKESLNLTMNDNKVAVRKRDLALQVFYLKVKQLIEKLEAKHPEFVYDNSIKKEKGVGDIEKDNKEHNDISF